MKYVKSFWAKRWLDDIRGPYDLDIGKKYSETRKYSNFEINGGNVSVLFKENHISEYKVSISFEQLSNKKKKKLAKIIHNDLNLYSSILNYEIPEKLYQILLDEKIYIGRNVNSKCRCKNDNIQCRHSLALIYLIYGKIKQDPFILFKLCGVDLFELIKTPNHMKSIDDILYVEDTGEKYYTIMPNLLINTLSLLQDEPVFYHVDFKSLLYDFFKFTKNHIVTIFNGDSEFRDIYILNNDFKSFDVNENLPSSEQFINKWMNPQKWKGLSINIDKNYNITNIDNLYEYNPFSTSNLDFTLFGFLAESKYASNSKFNNQITYLISLFKFTSKLISHNAIIPELFQLEDSKYCIRWIPAIYDKTIYHSLKSYILNCPDDLITVNNSKLPKYSQVLIAISLIISGFLKHFLRYSKNHNFRRYFLDDVFRLFFKDSQNLVEYPYAIQSWLSKLFLKNKAYKLCIQVDKHYKKYILSYHVISDGEVKEISSKNPEYVEDIYIIYKLFNNYGFEIDLNGNMVYNSDKLLQIYKNIFPLFEEYGIEIKNDSFTIFRPEIFVDTSQVEKLTLEELMKFDWKIAIGDKHYSVSKFEELVEKYNGLVTIDNQLVFFADNSKNLIKQIKDLSSLNKFELMHSVLMGDLNKFFDDKIQKLIENIKKIENVNVPESLNGVLRPYQEVGYSWLVQNIKAGFGSILADDMGLGKTIQVLTAILYLKENSLIDGNVLIIVPTSLLTNWQEEIEKFTPSLSSVIYHGSERKLPDEKYDIILTSYGVVRSDFRKFKNLFLIVIDEAQNIKNPQTKQTKAIKSLKSKYKIALTGTPVENRLLEYWSIFDFVNNGYLSNKTKFNKNFITPIEKDNNSDALYNFKKITEPFILRRQKSDKDIVPELPDKNVMDIYCNLTPNQTALYQQTLDSLLTKISYNEGIGRRGVILKLITALKQICNHPTQFLKNKEYKISQSGKMEVLINILKNILDNGEKVLIFTQYVEMGKIIQKIVSKHFKTEVLFLHGSLSRKKRDEIISKFQNDSKYPIFVLSLKTGGTGLNLTAAQNVIHYDLWWNPAVENQATDRAYRIGQDKNVMVYRFITKGTFEEKINNILTKKEKLAEMTVSTNQTFVTEMNDDELIDLLTLRNI